jgi:putative addiction module component (TIGR02574 family)
MGDLPLPQPPGFSDLTKDEQIRYLQALWDMIADQPGELPAPESHLQLAEQRLASYRADPSRARAAHEVIDRLAKKSS